MDIMKYPYALAKRNITRIFFCTKFIFMEHFEVKARGLLQSGVHDSAFSLEPALSSVKPQLLHHNGSNVCVA